MDKLTTLLACLPKSPFKDNLTEEIESLRQQLTAALAACAAKDKRIALALEFYNEPAFDVSDGLRTALAIKPDASTLRQHDEALIRRCAAHAKEALNRKGPFTCNVPEEILSLIKEL